MSKFTEEEIQNLAQAIRLKIEPEDMSWYQDQLGKVLDYLEVFKEVDTEGKEPLSQVTGLTNVLREDVVEPSLKPDQVFLNRESHDGYFVVSKVI